LIKIGIAVGQFDWLYIHHSTSLHGESMAESEHPLAVAMRGITKRFPGVVANHQVDFEVRRGEIHALLGENGAGKSTLMSVLCGLYQPDEGVVYLAKSGNGALERANIDSPASAINAGIGMVHQHFKLVSPQTVTENIILGLKGIPFSPNMRRLEAEIEALGEKYHMPVDPRAFIWQLSVGEQQRVEILKLLYRGADILILDEPTAVLTPQESRELAQILRNMAKEGKSIVFISHKLDEVMSYSDRVTVLRDGKNVATYDIDKTDKAKLAKEMVGREVIFRVAKQPVETGPKVLELENISAQNDKGLPSLKNVSLDIKSREILGIAGVSGNGQRELAEVVTGLRPTVHGRLSLNGEDLTNQPPLRFIERGVSHVPSDRLGMGLAGNLPVSDNLIMKAYRKPPIASGPILVPKAILRFAENLIKNFNVATPTVNTPARLLSGGNQQKAILAREIATGELILGSTPVLLVADHPTRGLDVGAIETVRKTLLEQQREGTAILFISEDLDELLSLSDRIAVLHGGEIMGVVDPKDVTLDELGLMMAGDMKK
jgi:general nucleoside transport system ATP-binding protein